MTHQLSTYSTIFFDCDGVILDSNYIKTSAFRKVSTPWGVEPSNQLVEFHVKNGGISRYSKFSHFCNAILPQYYSRSELLSLKPSIDSLSQSYSKFVREGLLACPIAKNLDKLRKQTPNSKWCIVSGGDQDELREIFTLRGISDLFNAGIFGSPDTKEEIFEKGFKSELFHYPAIYFGDSKYDFQSAKKFNIDFIFVSNWSEVHNWEEWSIAESLTCIESISSLLHR